MALPLVLLMLFLLLPRFVKNVRSCCTSIDCMWYLWQVSYFKAIQPGFLVHGSFISSTDRFIVTEEGVTVGSVNVTGYTLSSLQLYSDIISLLLLLLLLLFFQIKPIITVRNISKVVITTHWGGTLIINGDRKSERSSSLCFKMSANVDLDLSYWKA